MPTFDAAAPARTAISGYRPVAMTHDRKRTAYHPPAADRRAMDATQTADHHQIFDEKKNQTKHVKQIQPQPFPPGQRPTHSYPDQSRKKPYDKERANRLRFANGGCVVRGGGEKDRKKKSMADLPTKRKVHSQCSKKACGHVIGIVDSSRRPAASFLPVLCRQPRTAENNYHPPRSQIRKTRLGHRRRRWSNPLRQPFFLKKKFFSWRFLN